MTTTLTPPTCHIASPVHNTIGHEQAALSLEQDQENGLHLHFTAPRGLYQFSGIVDAQDFDWESLYVNLQKFHNVGQRTGPWDFYVGEGNQALVPSYWVSLNGERIGLWYFQRISLEDLEARRFRGRFAFYVETDGEQHLELVPYNYPDAIWLSTVLEVDSEEEIGAWPEGLSRDTQSAPVSAWTDSSFWTQQQQRLAAAECIYADALKTAFAWVEGRETSTDGRQLAELDLPLFVAGERLGYITDGIARALEIVDQILAHENFGNPREDAYGHNGDMGAGLLLLTLALAYHQLGPELGVERSRLVVAKLERQAKIYFRLLLLNRDYWGGSLMQDHGRRSAALFTVAALHLLGIVPEAEVWVRVLIPRLRRSIEAQPADGFVPPSSYNSTYLYLQELSIACWTLRSMGGPDLAEHPRMHAIVDFIWNNMTRSDRKELSTLNLGHVALSGGTSFFNWQAARHGDQKAALLHRLFMKGVSDEALDTLKKPLAYYHSRFWAFFMHEEMPPPMPLPASPPRRLHFCEDAGIAFFIDEPQQLQFKVQCGPWCGYTAYRKAIGPCDRMRQDVADGNFDLRMAGRSIFGMAPSRYFLHTAAGCTVLFDEQGQKGNIGYPMSIPSCPHWGEEISSVRWNADNDDGWIELNLAPAYPEAVGLLLFTRRFIFTAAKTILVRDRILLQAPRRVSWLYQTDQENMPQLDGLMGCVGPRDARITLCPQETAIPLQATLARTRQVYSYSSTFAVYHHFRYDTKAPVQDIIATFCIRYNQD